MNPKISVLIPVYNASEFLHYSIPSILNQTFNDIELICVNDGSTDDSLNILNNFANQDSRIKVIDKKNGGCGSARNRALEEANGEYVYFFDPDDKIEYNTLELSYNSAIKNNSDMVIFKGNVFDKNGISNRQTFFYYDLTLDKDKYDNLYFEDIKQHVLWGGYAPWSKLYKKDFLDSYDDFKFDLGLAFDDVPFHVKSMVRAEKISFINEFLYHYKVDNENSVNSTASNGFDIFKIIDIVEGILKSENHFVELIDNFYRFKVNHILLYIISTDSSKYYQMARERFGEIDKKYLENNSNLYQKFQLVLSVEDYETFKKEYEILSLKQTKQELKNKIKNLKKQNKKLKKKIKKLKKESDTSKVNKVLSRFK